METAFVLIDVDSGKVPEVVDKLNKFSQVTEVYSIAGEHDILAKLRFADIKSLGELIPKRIQKIDGIRHTATLLTFETHKYIDFDLAAGHKLEEK
ncbi:MAG: Lrp/AsnC family transcriptional regulator [Dehalococcoidia bacterium]